MIRKWCALKIIQMKFYEIKATARIIGIAGIKIMRVLDMISQYREFSKYDNSHNDTIYTCRMPFVLTKVIRCPRLILGTVPPQIQSSISMKCTRYTPICRKDVNTECQFNLFVLPFLETTLQWALNVYKSWRHHRLFNQCHSLSFTWAFLLALD